MITLSRCYASFLPFLLALFVVTSTQAQKEYQGLLWKISGNEMEKPSYLYGTMHVSSKVAFYLGQPFFDAIASVDRVALELEPEMWFDEVLGSDFMSSSYDASALMGYGYGAQNWNEFDDKFEIDRDLNLSILGIYKQSPQMLNQMLFRFYDATGNFEEDTWLDMYIYQAGKKLGKQTLGLETFQLSMEMMAKSEEEMKDAPQQSNRLTYKERQEAYEEIEAAYRKGDLDKLDSLQRVVSHEAYLKWILIERNKNFVNGMDTLMRQKPMFTGVGAAHLAGEEGMIEMLRARGFTVEPVPMGKRDSKQKDKITDMVLKRPLKPFTSGDGVISFNAPWEVYTVSLESKKSGSISMDIANGITFIVDRLMHFGSYKNRSREYMMASLDSLMYELIPGEILSKREIENNGNPGFDITNETRRGEIHRSQIIFMPDEVIVARLSATGDKIRKGAASHYFDSFKLNANVSTGWNTHGPADGSVKFEAPGRATSYFENEGNRVNADLYYQVTDANGDLYLVHRLQGRDKGFLDEDYYELDKLAWAFADDFDLEELARKALLLEGVLEVDFSDYNKRKVRSRFMKKGLGYYAFTAITNSTENANRFLASPSIALPQYKEWFPYEDTVRFFATSLPWEKDDKGMNLYQSDFFWNKKKDPYRYTSRRMNFNPPGKIDPIIMEYERFQPYSFNDDRADYEASVSESLADDGDLILIDELYQWNDTGCYSEHLLGDTLTHRQYKVRRWLQGRQRWTMTSIIDSAMGESAFAQTFVDSLSFMYDTLSLGLFVEEPYEQFMHDIMSTDSSTFDRANDRLRQSYSFADETRYKLYSALVENVPPLADKEDIESYKTRNIRIQWYDDSPENVTRLEEAFRAYTDSAEYQVEILKALINMKHVNGMKRAKKLLLWEAPIGVDIDSYSGMFGAMRDTLELSKLMFPELLDLTSYDEYEIPVLRLLSTMLDSSVVGKNVYRDRVSYFNQEAKVEFRRMNSSSDEDDQYHFDENDDDDIYPIVMDIYWNLLYPYRSLSSTQEFFDRCKNATRNHSIERYAWFQKERGTKVSDAIVNKLVEAEEPLRNYMMMKRLGRTDLYPDSLNIEKVFMENLMNKDMQNYTYGEVEDADSIHFILQRVDSIRGNYYNTYYYKYRYKDDSDNLVWKATVIMISQSKKGKSEPPFDAIWQRDIFDESESDNEQFEELRRTLIANNRKNNFGDYDYDYD